MIRGNPDLSIIILNWNTKQLLLNCLESIFKHTKGINFEVIVCDNNSSDGSREAAKKLFPNLKLIHNHENVGFAKGNNSGLKAAKGHYLLLLNTDTLINYNIFPKLVQWMDQHPQVGILGPRLLNSDGTIQSSAGFLPNLLTTFANQTLPLHQFPLLNQILPVLKVTNEKFYQTSHPVGWVSGSCFLIKREVYNQIGGLDENIFMYVEETEYCKRAQDAGWQVWYLANEHIYHLERGSSTTGKTNAILGTYSGLKYYFQKHQPAWQLPVLDLLLKLGALIRLPFNPSTYLKALRV